MSADAVEIEMWPHTNFVCVYVCVHVCARACMCAHVRACVIECLLTSVVLLEDLAVWLPTFFISSAFLVSFDSL